MVPVYLRERGLGSDPALLCAPMDGLTHSALRRLIADFGGCDALATEMIPARRVLHENVREWPRTKRRPGERTVVYQMLVNKPEEVAPAVRRLREVAPDVIDLNLGCPAPAVRRQGGGASLYGDVGRLCAVLEELRRQWDGPLTVKCRLGADTPDWRETFTKRLRIFEDSGLDALVIHLRFAGDKLKRRVRWEEMPWIASQTRLPLVGNGDIDSVERLMELRRNFPMVRGFMLGRIAAVQPWVFAQASGRTVRIDYAEVWERFVGYAQEDDAAEKTLGRVKLFTAYYARNFLFGHDLYRAVHAAGSLDEARCRALAFLGSAPQTCRVPSLAGL